MKANLFSTRPRPWEIGRRACLRGTGAAIGLPLLEAMLPSIKRARAAGCPAPKYMFIYHFNGGSPETMGCNGPGGGRGAARPGCLRPSTTGPLTNLGKVPTLLQPLEAAGLLGDINVVSDLHNAIGELGVGVHTGGDHGRAESALLTGVDPENDG